MMSLVKIPTKHTMAKIQKYDKKSIKEWAKRMLRQKVPGFSRLPRGEKRKRIRAVVEAMEKILENGGEFAGVPELSHWERIGLGELPEGVLTLKEATEMIEDTERTLVDLGSARRRKLLEDPLLRVIDEHLSDEILNRILAPPGLTPRKRDWMPSNLFRTEVLRTLKYPEFTVRKFCTEMKKVNKYAEERAFCGMPANRNMTISHSSLSAFRNTMSPEMCLNLMVYMAALFFRSGRLSGAGVFALDSTDLATQSNSRILGKVVFPDGEAIRWYGDLDADCGTRRKKRDKSEMFVGYRVHTLCVVDAKTQHAFPLFSLAVAPNHHDSQLLEPMLDLARSIGLELKVLLGDDAYADVNKQRELLAEDDIILLTPDRENTPPPEGVDPVSGEVRCSPECPVPMRWDGFDKEERKHIFSCADEGGECFLQNRCPKETLIPLDNGLMRAIPNCVDGCDELMNLRKVAERPFNLMKHMDGLEPCRMRTKQSVSAQVVFSQCAGIFKAIAGMRSQEATKPKKPKEVPLFATG